MTRIPAAALFVMTFASVGSYAQQPDRSKLAAAFAEVDRLMREYATQAHAPGAVWGIVVGGELAHTGTTGFRDVAAQAPVDADTVFPIAPMPKTFTAMSVLKLAHPEEQSSAMLRAGIPFSNAPGLASEYSNLGFAILGRIVSNVSKMKYADYVAANILKPLAMTSTTLEPNEVAPPRLARGYRWEDAQWKDEPLLSNGSFGSMGGMLASGREFSRYVGVLLSAWPPHDGPETAPIRRASLREMQQLWRPASATVRRNAAGTIQLTSGGYAYGLRVSQSCAFR